jgi:hypothetical protein
VTRDARIQPDDLKDLVVLMDLPYSESLGDHDDSIYLSDLDVPERVRKIATREWVMGWMIRSEGDTQGPQEGGNRLEVKRVMYEILDDLVIPNMQTLTLMDKCLRNPPGPIFPSDDKDLSLKIHACRDSFGQEIEDDTAEFAFETAGQSRKLTMALDGDKSATLSQGHRNKWVWMIGMVLFLNGILIVAYDIEVDPVKYVTLIEHPKLYISPGPKNYFLSLLRRHTQKSSTLEQVASVIESVFMSFSECINKPDQHSGGRKNTTNSTLMRMANEVNEKSRSCLALWKSGPKPNLKVRDPRGGPPSGGFQNLTNKRQQIQFRGVWNHGMGDHGQQGGVDRQGQMPEWFCPSCNTKNFETRLDCRRCRTAKPVGVTPSVQNLPNPGSLGGNTVVLPQGPAGLPVAGAAQGRQ